MFQIYFIKEIFMFKLKHLHYLTKYQIHISIIFNSLLSNKEFSFAI